MIPQKQKKQKKNAQKVSYCQKNWILLEKLWPSESKTTSKCVSNERNKQTNKQTLKNKRVHITWWQTSRDEVLLRSHPAPRTTGKAGLDELLSSITSVWKDHVTD